MAGTLLLVPVLASDAYEVTTPGKAGTAGVVPQLAGLGLGSPGSSSNTLLLTGAFADASAALIVGWSELAAPFQGGVLGPAPDFLKFGYTVDREGELAVPFAVSLQLPVGAEFWAQFWVDDPGAPGGRSATNTLKFTVQSALETHPPIGASLMFPGPHYLMDSASFSPLLCDVDLDGELDLVSHSSLGEISVRRGVGDGTLGPLLTCDPGEKIFGLAAGDVNADGWPDLVGTSSATAAEGVVVVLNAGDGSFGAAESYGPGLVLRGLVMEDLDADGVLDLVGWNNPLGAFEVTTLLGDGAGGFHFAETQALPFPTDETDRAAVGLLNGDAYPDFAVTLTDHDVVLVFLGEGDGSLSTPQVIPAGDRPRDIALRDLNADGVADLVVLNAVSDDVAVMLGAGDGSFGPPAFTPVGDSPTRMDVADLNADGALDLAVALLGNVHDSRTIAVLLGTGDGSFEPKRFVRGPVDPRAILSGDLDRDGVPDLLAATHFNVSLLHVLIGNGDGSFPEAPLPLTPIHPGPQTAPSELVVGDLNGDGALDLVVDYDSPTMLTKIGVSVNAGAGGLGGILIYEAGGNAQGVAVGDVTGDGVPDAVVSLKATHHIAVFPGAGDGRLDPPYQVFAGLQNGRLDLADMNGDGLLDVVVAIKGGPLLLDGVAVLLSQGDGSFAASQQTSIGMTPQGVELGDFNSDGLADVLVYSHETEVISMATGLGDGTLAAVHQDLVAFAPVLDVDLVDWNGDGLLDVLSYHESGPSVGVFPGNGDGTFEPPIHLDAIGNDSKVVVADLDADGVPDLLAEDSNSQGLDVFLGLGGGDFTYAQDFSLGSDFGDLVCADIDGDGMPDLLTVGAGGVWVLRNRFKD